MQARLVAATALAFLKLAATPAFAAPGGIYLQNVLHDRGRCLGTAGPSVAMMGCDQSPAQQWFSTPGDFPGSVKYHTAGGGEGVCLAVHPNDRQNTLSMEACSQADNQQWYVEHIDSLDAKGGLVRLTNGETGASRCLEAMQSGMRMTPCIRRQSGHLWQRKEEPTM